MRGEVSGGFGRGADCGDEMGLEISPGTCLFVACSTFTICVGQRSGRVVGCNYDDEENDYDYY